MCTQLSASTALLVVLAASSGLLAQGSQSEHQLGGLVNAIWLEPIPLLGGQPDAFRVWTAEDGSRIRVYDSVTDTFIEDHVVSVAPQTLHDIYVAQYSTVTVEKLFGVAVGTGGEAVCWDSQGHSIWNVFPADPAPGKELWACSVEHAVAGTTIWVAGADHTLRCSTDRGHNWSDGIWTTSPAPGAMLTSLDFADWALPGKNGVVGTNSGELFFTTDGKTWTAATINGLPTPSSPLVFWDISFRPGSSTEAFAVGGRVEGNGEGFAWRTIDGGQTWNRVLTHFDATGLARVPINNVLPGNACSGVRGLSRGKNNHVHYATLYGCHALANGQAIFCAYAGQIWRYRPNTGTTFDILDNYEFTPGPLWGCHGDGNQEIWLSGQFGVLRQSSDHGRSWQAKSPSQTWRLKALDFATATTGYVGGQSMRLAKTIDGGVTWTEQLAYHSGANLGQGIDALAAYDQNSVVAIGNQFDGRDPVVFQTSDGGATCWSQPNLAQTLPATPTVSFVDVEAGALDAGTSLPTFWVCGSTASNWSGLMKSIDGGMAWMEVLLQGADYSWAGVEILGATSVIVVGKKISTNQAAAFVSYDATVASPVWIDISPVANGTLRGVAVTGAAAFAVANNGRIFQFDPALGIFALAPGSAGVTSEHLYRAEIGFNGTFSWVYVTGDNGVLLRSAVGSGSWEVLHSGTTDNVRGLALRVSSSNVEAWLTGKNGRWGDSTVIHMK